MSFKLTVEGFPEGGDIPRKFTGEGEDVSPALRWTAPPPGTKSFALIVDDPDAPMGVWNHWLLWDIPAETRALPQGYAPAPPVRAGSNDFGKQRYGGPYPPRGHGPHRYYFRLLAVGKASLGLNPGANRAHLDRAIEEHVLEEASYMGRYERKK